MTASSGCGRGLGRVASVCALVGALFLGAIDVAEARKFRRTLSRGSKGSDVRALEIRVAGWFREGRKTPLRVDRYFGGRTVRAVKAYQRHYGLTVDGIAGPQTFRSLHKLEDRNGSTAHFDWSEFKQKRVSRCRRGNRFANTFKGGRVKAAKVRRNVRRLMWRLEAMRAKAGGRWIRIDSGFRSVAYNRCVGGARLSQHLYGTATDITVNGIDAHRTRNIARHSQFHGIACYRSNRHTHLDIRIENRDLRKTRFWWWPERDKRGRDLDSVGKPCRGERRR